MSSSKPFTFGPKGATQLASNASCMYFNSVPPMCGDDNHILSFMVFVLLQIYILIEYVSDYILQMFKLIMAYKLHKRCILILLLSIFSFLFCFSLSDDNSLCDTSYLFW